MIKFACSVLIGYSFFWISCHFHDPTTTSVQMIPCAFPWSELQSHLSNLLLDPVSEFSIIILQSKGPNSTKHLSTQVNSFSCWPSFSPRRFILLWGSKMLFFLYLPSDSTFSHKVTKHSSEILYHFYLKTNYFLMFNPSKINNFIKCKMHY